MNRLAPLIFALMIPLSAVGQLSQGAGDLEKSVERRVEVTENKTIFTLFCLLNLGGYDEENNPDGMHPVRVHVRQQLVSKVRPELAKRIRDYYRQHSSAQPSDYSVVAMSTGGPPDFKFTVDWPDISKEASFAALVDLPMLLRELYTSAPIEEIYAAVRPDYLKYIEEYRAAVVAQVAKVMAYCRTSELSAAGGGDTPHAVVIPNLLLSFSRAFGFVLGDTFYSIEGPQTKIGFNPHEFVHGITNSMSYDSRYKALQEPAEPLFELAKKQPDVGDVANLQNFLDENLVRAISLKYRDNGDPARSKRLQEAMMQEYRSGYTLELFFYEQLSGFEKSNEPLSEYYPTMLRHLNVKDELARWEQTAKSRPK
ncbi:MAG: hypothetical protein WCA13_17840 [Terriglobales bacterium]